MVLTQVNSLLHTLRIYYPNAVAWGYVTLILLFVFLIIPLYIYQSYTLTIIAKKLKLKHKWISWVPIINFSIVLRGGGFHFGWLSLLIVFILPLSNFVRNLSFVAAIIFYIICMYKICLKLKFPAWSSIIIAVPFFGFLWNLILFGILAFKDVKVKI